MRLVAGLILIAATSVAAQQSPLPTFEVATVKPVKPVDAQNR